MLACELCKPLFLHERDAHTEMVEILVKYSERQVSHFSVSALFFLFTENPLGCRPAWFTASLGRESRLRSIWSWAAISGSPATSGRTSRRTGWGRSWRTGSFPWTNFWLRQMLRSCIPTPGPVNCRNISRIASRRDPSLSSRDTAPFKWVEWGNQFRMLEIILLIFLQRNEPCSLPVTVEMIAAYLKKTPEEVALATTFNALKVFGLSG